MLCLYNRYCVGLIFLLVIWGFQLTTTPVDYYYFNVFGFTLLQKCSTPVPITSASFYYLEMSNVSSEITICFSQLRIGLFNKIICEEVPPTRIFDSSNYSSFVTLVKSKY